MSNPLSPEQLVYDLEVPGDPQVSPDGMSILFSLARVDREANRTTSELWLCAIDGSDRRQLTQSGGRNGGARWSPDGRTIAFTSDRGEDEGIFLLPATGPGEARLLVSHRRQVSDLTWSPDARSIAYTVPYDPDDPDEERGRDGGSPVVRVTRRIDYKQDGRGYLGDTRFQVFVVDVGSGRRRRLTSQAVDHHWPQWSTDGRCIAVEIPNRNGMHSQLGLVDVGSGETTLVGSEDGVVAVWAWSATGDRIIYAGDIRQTHQTDFFLYHHDTGQIRRLTDDLDCLPAGGRPGVSAPSQPVWLDERRVLFHAVRAGASGLYTIDVESATVEPIHSWPATNGGLSLDAQLHYAVQSYSSLDRLAEISVFDLQAGRVGIVTSYNHELLQQSPMAGWERFDVRREPYTIEAWLLKPADFDPAKRYPVILDVHGGPNGYYGYGYTAWQQCLATNGFLLVFSNPRGSSSYGRNFTQQVVQDWGGEDYQDLLAVVDSVAQRPYADPERVGIFGYSYGGYMTAWAIGQSDRFRAAVCGAPCFDLESMFGTADIGHAFGEQQWGGAPHEAAKWYEAHSPSSYAHRATTPTLIVHGEADERCPIGQAEQMFVALKRAGCEVEFARYPGAAHTFPRNGRPDQRVDLLARTLGWFKEYLGEPV